MCRISLCVGVQTICWCVLNVVCTHFSRVVAVALRSLLCIVTDGGMIVRPDLARRNWDNDSAVVVVIGVEL